MTAEFIIRNGRVLTADGLITADVRIADSRIAEVGGGIAADSAGEIDAAGLLVLPGIVDAHVHFNEPGRTHWEGFATGSRALAAGGGASFVDMPLNASPPTLDRESFALKRAAGEVGSVLDFGLWGGLTPGNLGSLAELAACGVVGFKAFMIESGMDDFPAIDARSLREGMRIAAGLGLPVAVHAEDAAIIAGRTAAIRASGRRDAAAFLESRPVESEVAAVRVALDLAGETGCALQVVHVSCAEAVRLIAGARAAGVDVTVEACPHHLLLNDRAMARHGAHAKCAPPLREEAIRAGLWAAVLDGLVDSIGSDHSPAPPEMKTGDNLFAAWGGIMGCQHGFLLLLDRVLAEAPERLPEVWRMLSENPACRLGLADRKGAIAPGLDADIVLVETGAAREIDVGELLTRHRTSPYVGQTLRSKVVHTFRRGEMLDLRSTGGGKFLPASRG